MNKGMTISEKIIARHAGKESVRPGDHLMVRVDFMVANDITAPLAVKIIDKIPNVDLTAVRDRIAIVPDHFTPSKDIASAENVKMLREFVRKHDLKHFFEIGRCGVEHYLIPEQGLVNPGELIIGADSHTCTYGALGCFAAGVGSTDFAYAMLTGEIWLKIPESIKLNYAGLRKPWVYGKDLILMTLKDLGPNLANYRALEFTGETIRQLPMHQRFTICNMAVEAGAKNGIITPDKITRSYIGSKNGNRMVELNSDPDARYALIKNYDVSELEPQVACPHSPSNVESIKSLKKISIDQVFIGSCTNGWYDDLAIAASVLKGRKIASSVRLIVAPATPRIYNQAMADGLLKIFAEADAVIGPPTCGPCLGGHCGVLAAGESALSTTNRNFIGRMGHADSAVYLANPAVAAASAITGYIIHPEEII